MTTEDSVLEVIRRNLLVVLPDLDPAAVTPRRSLAELGCNSVDRADVVAMTMEELNVRIPITEFAEVQDLRSLVGLMCRHVQ